MSLSIPTNILLSPQSHDVVAGRSGEKRARRGHGARAALSRLCWCQGPAIWCLVQAGEPVGWVQSSRALVPQRLRVSGAAITVSPPLFGLVETIAGAVRSTGLLTVVTVSRLKLLNVEPCHQKSSRCLVPLRSWTAATRRLSPVQVIAGVP